MILVGNKIDLRGGEVTNQALEDEVVPIMNEFKVYFMWDFYEFRILMCCLIGSRNMRRVFSQDASERFRGILFCAKGRPPSDRAAVRFAGSCQYIRRYISMCS